MLEFKNITADNIAYLDKAIKAQKLACSDYSIAFIYMWLERDDIKFAECCDGIVFMQNYFGTVSFGFPMGGNVEKLMERVVEYTKSKCMPLILYAINEDRLNVLKSIFGDRLLFDYDRIWSEYVYDAEKLKNLIGSDYAKIRNNISRFKRDNPTYSYIDLKNIEKTKILEFLSVYKLEHITDNKMENSEYKNTVRILDYFHKLNIIGRVIVINDKVVGLTIAEKHSEQIIVLVEKSLKAYPGCNQTMFNDLLNEYVSHETKYVNRQDDSGDTGLRIAKLRYRPEFLMHKYTVSIDSPLCKIKKIPTIELGDIMLAPLTKDYAKAYFDLNVDDELNKYWGYDYKESLYIPLENDYFYNTVNYGYNVGDNMCVMIYTNLGSQKELIGEVVLHNMTCSRAEVGCRLFAKFHGKGYGTRAIHALAVWTEKTLKLKPFAKCYKQNLASKAMLGKAGFKEKNQDDTFIYFDFINK